MIVMVLEKVPQAMRGELTRWLIEVKPGVYVGHANGMVRERLWEKCSQSRGSGAVFQAWSTNTEQKFKMRLNGENGREVIDWEGLQLIREAKDELTAPQKRRVKSER
jgi:CRISPR-associated protein Cas2